MSLSAAIAFHEKYVEIERNMGMNKAIEFQRTESESKKFEMIAPEQISITIKGDEVIITF